MPPQLKKPTYDVYPLFWDRTIASSRKGLSKSESSKITDTELIRRYCRLNPGFTGEHGFYSLAEDRYFKSGGSQVIFPESSVVLDNLLKARYAMQSPEGFTLPFSSLVLSPMRGYRYQGVEIPSIFATWVPSAQYRSEILDPFLGELGVAPSQVSYEDLPDQGMLIICYAIRNGAGHRRTAIYGEDLPELLAAKDSNAFVASMRRLSLMHPDQTPDDDEVKRQFFCLRLIAALGVYHLATEGRRLRLGFPTTTQPRLDGRKPGQAMSPITLTNALPSFGEGVTPVGHFRTWYFRQLRDKMYYRGEYEHLPQGSRYTFVTEALIGDLTANTQA